MDARSLQTLADAFGISPGSSDSARRAILDAAGCTTLPGSHEPPLIQACRVVPPDHVRLHVDAPVHQRWQLTVQPENGQAQVRDGMGPTRVELPVLPYGYHAVHVACGDRLSSQVRIVTPQHCVGLPERAADGPRQGVWCNLASVRGASSWGFGDLTDLGAVARWAGRAGADFLGIPPLHALATHGDAINPYTPLSHIYRSLLYLDVEATPEFRHCPDAHTYLRRPHAAAALRRVRASEYLDHATVHALKAACVHDLFRVFRDTHLKHDTPRGRAYHAFTATQGVPLYDFAVFCALDAHFEHRDDWHHWPARYQNPQSATVQRFAVDQSEAVAEHMYVQFELDRQLHLAAQAAQGAGMSVGLYQNLALGEGYGGADPWLFRNLFVEGVTVGTPADAFAVPARRRGLPPLNPHALTRDGYRYWRLLLRQAFTHGGALRLDDVSGLFRQFWIPRGHDATDGAYVRYPHRDLLGILALESQRHGAAVMGEDSIGLPAEERAVLAHWNVLSSDVLYFKKTRGGQLKPTEPYQEGHIAATMHRTPISSFARGREVLLRHKRAAPSRPLHHADWQRAIRHARAAPAPLVGFSLDDLAGESLESAPTWTHRMRQPLTALAMNPSVSAPLHR